jgi:hypothetical protein
MPLSQSQPVLVSVLLGSVALSSSCVAADTAVLAAPEVYGRVEWVIGVADGDPHYEFGRIRGLALRGDRVYVADAANHEIRIFDGSGRFVHSMGRPGNGPGELRSPCCIDFDQRGRLWIWNATDRDIRYDVFDVDDGGSFVDRLSTPLLGQIRARRILFDEHGNLVHPMGIPESEKRRGTVRLTLDSTGSVVRRVYPPYVPPDSLGMAEVQISALWRRHTVYLSLPASPGHPLAHSPRGGYADAITSRYLVRWFDSDGELVRIIEQPIIHGPALTSEEVTNWEKQVLADRRSLHQQGATVPDMPIPSHKHPLEYVFFDLDGRLWVERSASGTDSLKKADVYGPDGSYSATVRWPLHVDLSYGAIRGRLGYGVTRDSLDVPGLAQLVFDFPESSRTRLRTGR